MLINFKFANFMSFKEECFFDMSANSDKSHRELLIDDKYSKAKMIYGANASGKTSFIKAIDFVRWFVFNSSRMIDGAPIPVVPFKFCEQPFDSPSSFAFTFIKNGKKYYYEFSCTREKVISEKLDRYDSSKPTNVFERNNVNEYVFRHDVKTLKEISQKNTANKLFLVTSATWNYAETKPVVDFFLNDIMVSYGLNQGWQAYLSKIRAEGQSEEFSKFSLDLFNNADISIDNFVVEEKKYKDLPQDAVLNSVISVLMRGDQNKIEQFDNASVYNIWINHKIKNEGVERVYQLNIQEESLGTIGMFELSTVLYYVLKNGTTFFIDEIDRSLHPLLVRYIVNLFFNSKVNINNAQIIANTHDTNLLDLDLFRRDEIWFTERDYESGSTTIFPLTDFSPRKDENIEKAYLLGRFGAVPFIKGE